MVDTLSKGQRSYVMSRIRSSNTQPELKLKNTLKILGFTYQPKEICGSPDFANKKEKTAIFVDGCFWHRCGKHFKMPKSNTAFWRKKIEGNVERDKLQTALLRRRGWRVVRIWEHEIGKMEF